MTLKFASEHSSTPGTIFKTFDLKEAPFKFGEFTVGPGATSKLDSHQVRECWYVSEGSGELILNGEKQGVMQGQTLFFNSFESHQIHNTGDRDIKIISIWWNHEAV